MTEETVAEIEERVAAEINNIEDEVKNTEQPAPVETPEPADETPASPEPSAPAAAETPEPAAETKPTKVDSETETPEAGQPPLTPSSPLPPAPKADSGIEEPDERRSFQPGDGVEESRPDSVVTESNVAAESTDDLRAPNSHRAAEEPTSVTEISKETISDPAK